MADLGESTVDENNNSCVEWTNETCDLLIDERSVPDFWTSTTNITFGTLRQIVNRLEERGEPHHRLIPILRLLKPDIIEGNIPQLQNIRRKLKSKSLNVCEVVPWTINTRSLGEECDSLGITESQLTGTLSTLPAIQRITNGLILELRRHWVRHQCKWKVFVDWVFHLASGTFSPAEYVLRRKVSEVHKKHMKLITRRKPNETSSFLQATFSQADVPSPSPLPSPTPIHNNSDTETPDIPCPTTSRQEPLGSSTNTISSANDIAPQHSAAPALSNDLGVQPTIEEFKQRLAYLKKTYDQYRRNSVRREYRRDAKIQEQACTISSLKDEVTTLQHKLHAMSQERKKMRDRQHYFKERCASLSQERKEHMVEKVSNNQLIRKKEEEVKQLIDRIHSMLSEHVEIDTQEDGSYTDQVRQTVMALGSMGVSTANIAKVIDTVAQNLFAVSLSKLPSPTTVKQFLLEANIVGQLQVCDTLLHESDLTLHTDGTTDHQRHFFGYQVSTSSQNLTLAVTETVASDAATQLLELRQRVTDVASLLTEDDGERDSHCTKMLMAVTNLMTDQHCVNVKFKQDFEQLRESLLQKSMNNWNLLSETEKSKSVKLNQWFCFLHVLLGLADAAEDALKDYQGIVTCQGAIAIGREQMGKDCWRGSSAVFEAIKSVCALLTPTGHPAAGIPQDFKSWLLSSKRGKCQLVKFAHNRFNVIFLNASATWLHRTDIVNFLHDVKQTNQLIATVKADMADSILLACIRGLAMFHVLVTDPFHALILSEQTTHILDLNPYLLDLQTTLEAMSSDPWIVLEDSFSLWASQPFHRKCHLYQHVMPSSRDEAHLEISVEVLGIISTHALVTFTREVQSHLPGGEHASSTSTKRQEANSVPKSNSIGESQFALLKQLRHDRPNATLQNIEGSIMWAYNKTLNWLNNIPATQKNELLRIARQKTPEFKEKWATRRRAVIEQRFTLLKHKDEVHKAKAHKTTLGRQKVLNEIEEAGQCRSVEDVEGLMAVHSTDKERVTAVKAQLRYYKTIIASPGVDKSLYLFSHKGRVYDATQLSNNLKEVIRQHTCYLEQKPATSSNPDLPEQSVRQRELETLKKAVLCNYTKAPGSQSCIKGTKRKSDFPNPIGKRIRHRWKLGKRHKWYSGQVLRLSAEDEAPTHEEDEEGNAGVHGKMYDLYQIRYDGEDEVFNLRIEKDWFRGDLDFVDW